LFDQNANKKINIIDIEMNNVNATDNITEELSKLLRQEKEKNDNNNNNNDDSDDDAILETPVTETREKNTDNNNNINDKLSSKDIVSAVSDLRSDTLKILEMLTELNSEVNMLKDRFNRLENKKNNNNDSLDEMQEQIDKILSVKLDGLKQKIKKNLKSSHRK